ncbi:hypothetical protein ILUMI_15074 [Ignelater luminosus]|uniref:Uncharacterized protein n=1 Tax=Ignelater luminosus TaxID=2038154 RepID=A0A8K0CPA5_IGNLU|nr:hypothetical protein ILUMI_15074 [Ignelater luminosus]
MWFQQDGASSHRGIEGRRCVNNGFLERWIGRGGFVAWSPRLPDLSPIGFSASHVRAEPVHNAGSNMATGDYPLLGIGLCLSRPHTCNNLSLSKIEPDSAAHV